MPIIRANLCRISLPVALVLTLLLGPARLEALAADTAAPTIEFQTQIKPLLTTHCYACHSGSDADAGLALDHFDNPIAFLKGRSVWKKALQKLRIKAMPPPEVSGLSSADRQVLIDWIDGTLQDVECGLTPNPGQVTLRRLNATEYQNTIRDLLGVSYTPAANFPGDDVGYGFDHIGDVLTLPPILMEKYLLAAERISRIAIQTPPPAQEKTWNFQGAQLQTTQETSGAGELTLVSQTAASFTQRIPWAGSYELTITASGDQAGAEACRLGVAVDGKIVHRIVVPNPRSQPHDYAVSLSLQPGDRQVSIRFLNDFYQPALGGRAALDRNLVIHHVRLWGRQPGSEQLAPNTLSRQHQRIIFTRPTTASNSLLATQHVIERLASRAFRRPVEPDDLQRLVELARGVQQDGGSFEESIQVALQAILISPRFLFRVEPPSQPPAAYGAEAASLADGASEFRVLDEFELATRLSYFLYSSMPDDELLSLAWRGELRKGDNIQRQINRMLHDKRSNAFVENFASQWLTLRRLEDFEPSPSLFPKWNDEIAQLATRETLTFFADIVRNDMSILRLLDGDFTWLNEPLATYYGISGVQGDAFRKVSLQGTPRAGLLTQASILAVTSNPTRTSPVKRGKWILDNLLASPPPPAPPGVPELKDKGQLGGSLRQQLEQHRADPACASCHKLMDPLGFALENFDAVGIYRQRQNGQDIDASGVLPNGTRVVGASELQAVLVNQHQEEFINCFTEKMLTYALGRGLEYYDKCVVDAIVDSLRETDYKFSTLLAEIVLSDPFQKQGQREIQ